MSAPATVSDRHARLRAAVAITLLAALVVFAALADELAEWQPFVSLDRHVDELLNERATPAPTTAMEAVTWLGSTNGLVLLTLAACAVLLVRRRVRAALLVALALVGAEVLDALLKVEFARPRPSLAHPLVAEAGGYSVPSGHATGSMAVYGAIAYLSLTTVRSRPTTAVITAGALLVVVLIGFSRVYLGEHFPSDVIAGWCVGVAWVAILVLLLWGALPAFATPRATEGRSARPPPASARRRWGDGDPDLGKEQLLRIDIEVLHRGPADVEPRAQFVKLHQLLVRGRMTGAGEAAAREAAERCAMPTLEPLLESAGRYSHCRALEVDRDLAAAERRGQREAERREQLLESGVGDHERPRRLRAGLVGLADPVAPLRVAFFDAGQLVSGRSAPGMDVAVDGGQRIGPHRGLLTGLAVAYRGRDRAPAAVDLHQNSFPSR
jgi:membrane-associated phospholipid phosphatase